MSWFKAFRNEYGFMLYKDNPTAVSFDMPLLVVTYVCALVSIATLLATLGIRGHEKWSAVLRAIYSLGIGSIILACIFGHGWQLGSVNIKMPYVYRNNQPFEGEVGINVALDGANVTLHGQYYGANTGGFVHYAESMTWADYGQEFQRFGYFLSRGLPAPVLKVMEYLTIDSGSLRWGRSFHTSGQYAFALLWTAFAFWIVTNVLLLSVIVYGAYMCFLTGMSMILACVAYHSCQNSLPLSITFENDRLTLSYGWCFWLTLSAGILTALVGLILFILDYFASEEISDFFHLEKIVDEEHFEVEDRRGTNPNLLMDRRGSIVPPNTERRGSIFLDPCRQTSPYNNGRSKSISLGELTGIDKFKDDLQGTRKNPLFNIDGSKKQTDQTGRDDVSINMECLCEESEVCISTKKPSLATLKEHRENHANEILSMSGNSQKSNSSSTNKLSVPENLRVPRVSFCQPEIQTNFSRRASEGDILKPNFMSDRPSSGLSVGFDAVSDLEKKLAGEDHDENEVEVKCPTFSRQDSTDSSSSESSTKSNISYISVGNVSPDTLDGCRGENTNITTIDVTIDIEKNS